MNPTIGPVWIEVDLDRIAANVRAVREYAGRERRFMAVVKNDGYGHGAVPIALTALENGATDLGVTALPEALELRDHGITAPILLFNSVMPEDAPVAIAKDITCSVFTDESAGALAAAARRAGTKARIHVEVDTGMTRYGVPTDQAVDFITRWAADPALLLEGVYAHFAAAPTGKTDLVRREFSRLQQVFAELAAKRIDVPIRHAASTEAMLIAPETMLDMVRVGNLLYGLTGCDLPPGAPQVLRAFALKARLHRVVTVPPGTGIGYGPDYVTRRPMTIATVPIGYGDSVGVEPLSRQTRFAAVARSLIQVMASQLRTSAGRFSPTRSLVAWNGRDLPVVGRIGMNQLTVDVTGRDVHVGDTVDVHINVMLAGRHLPRVFLRGGQPMSVRTLQGDFAVTGADSAGVMNSVGR